MSETLKEATGVNREIEGALEGVESSYLKLQRIDLELQGQLDVT